jgi:RND superfamily putative drug exporter
MPFSTPQEVTMSDRNIAARAGAWSARHRRTAVIGWIVFVIAAAAIGGTLGTNTGRDDDGIGESGRADVALNAHFPDDVRETVLVQGRHGERADAPAFREVVRYVVARVSRVPHVSDVRSPYAPRGELSEDGRSALVSFQIAGDEDEASERVDAALAVTAAAQRAHPSFRVEQFGEASAMKALDKSVEEDFQRAEVMSLPITLVILVIAFGSLVAAGLPLLLGMTAVGATLGLVNVVSQLMPMDPSITSVVLMIGLAVGIDYSLFYLRREREERAAGRDEQAALVAAAATSGRAVLVSGLTVMIAMAGMFLAGSSVFSGFAVGTILVVAVAMVGSLTVLPALMSKLGDRVEKGRVPLLGRLRRGRAGDSRLWGAVVDRVLRRPALASIVAGGALLALALPTLGLNTALPGLSSLPRDLPEMQTYDRIQAAFPGNPAPGVVVVQARDVRSPEVQRGVAALVERVGETPGLLSGVQTRVSPDDRVETVSVPLAGDGTDERSEAALARLRELVPATVGGAQGVEWAGVTGETAGTHDFNETMDSHLPYVFAFVLGMAFLLLLVTFRSVVIPLQAIALNLLSVGAAYGLLVLVFQDGHGEQLLGFESTGAIASWLPLFLFVVLFGLSMDYHVFILSRVREAVDRGMSTGDAVAHAVRTTSGVVTSAAVVMVAVFAIFATLRMIEMKQMGVGLAAAILIDATVIRGVLLPATLKLLGERAWYLPRALRWVSRGERSSRQAAAPARA